MEIVTKVSLCFTFWAARWVLTVYMVYMKVSFPMNQKTGQEEWRLGNTSFRAKLRPRLKSYQKQFLSQSLGLICDQSKF